MPEIKVSVIVPVYNGERYLKECLDSLVNQTLSDIEIICVNDGSKDNSLNILREYEKNNLRIRIINQENQGVSIARNKGISIAKGKYLTFCDCDDWLELNSLEKLYNAAITRESDLLLFSFNSYYNEDKIEKDNRLKDLCAKLQNGNAQFIDLYKEIFNSPMGVCSKFYKTELLKQNNILFPEEIQCGEDRPFYIKACVFAKNISVIDEPFYYYRRNVDNSITQGNAKTVCDMYEINQMIKKIIYDFEDKNNMYLAFLDEYIRSVLWGWNISDLKSNRIKDIKYLKYIKKECEEFKNCHNFPIETYKRLLNTIKEYNNLFLAKLFEPFFEFEKREKRIALYILERQIINIPS